MNRPAAVVIGVVVVAVVFLTSLRPMTLDVVTRPDPRKPGHLGIGLYLRKGKRPVSPTRGGDALSADVVIKTPGGEVVHQATEALQKFRFG